MDVEIIVLRNDIGNLSKEYIERKTYYYVTPVREVLIKKGKGNALNVGIKLSSGELITILKMVVQIPIVVARSWGMASFPWRRLVW